MKSSKAEGLFAAYDTVKPFIDRAIEDESIKDNVVRAFKAARDVYGELNGETPIGAAAKLSDKDKVRGDLDTTISSLSEAIVKMSGEKHRARNSGLGLFLVAIVVIVILFNPATGTSTRAWLRDHLFGNEEEFDYNTPKY